MFFSAGPVNSSRALLGAVRLEVGRRLGLIDEAAWAFVWVVDAPLFELAAETDDVAVGSGAWTAVHHAFTSPKPEFLDTFDTDPGSALAYAYDIVCNGNEIGGGSIRIHRRDVQERVFAIMGLAPEDAQEKFGFLLDAFAFGAPPHGGIAFGWDRICALLSGTDSIRDVIAFPKTGGGFDPLTAAPAGITAEQRKEAGIDFVPDAPVEKANAETWDETTPRRPRVTATAFGAAILTVKIAAPKRSLLRSRRVNTRSTCGPAKLRILKITRSEEPPMTTVEDPVKTAPAAAPAVAHPDFSPALYNEDLAPATEREWGVYSLFCMWMSDIHSVGGYSFAAGLFFLGLNGWWVFAGLVLATFVVDGPDEPHRHRRPAHGHSLSGAGPVQLRRAWSEPSCAHPGRGRHRLVRHPDLPGIGGGPGVAAQDLARDVIVDARRVPRPASAGAG